MPPFEACWCARSSTSVPMLSCALVTAFDHVDHCEVERLATQRSAGIFRARHVIDGETGTRERPTDGIPDQPVILDDEHSHARF